MFYAVRIGLLDWVNCVVLSRSQVFIPKFLDRVAYAGLASFPKNCSSINSMTVTCLES
jgi:hypothetical protein